MVILTVSIQRVFELLVRRHLIMELMFESHRCGFSGIKILDNTSLGRRFQRADTLEST